MNQKTQPWRHLFTGVAVIATFLATLVGFAGAPTVSAFTKAHATSNGCQLNSAKGDIQHVIYIQFDNTHFLRRPTWRAC